MSILPFEDRRMFVRFPVAMPARFFRGDIGIKGNGCLRDISASGLCIETKERLDARARMRIDVQIPHVDQPFSTAGAIVWVQRIGGKKYRAGVMMDKIELMGVWRVLNAGKAAGNGHVSDSKPSEAHGIRRHLSAIRATVAHLFQ